MIYDNKRVLLTGGSGFLGSRLRNYPSKLFFTLGRTSNSDVKVDLVRDIPNLDPFDNLDRIIHAAGKAHTVPKDLSEEEEFYKVNVDGTSNLLLGIDGWVKLKDGREYPKQFVFVSTVAEYGLEAGKGNSENQILEPASAYGKS